jgi:hypothetical protein
MNLPPLVEREATGRNEATQMDWCRFVLPACVHRALGADVRAFALSCLRVTFSFFFFGSYVLETSRWPICFCRIFDL